MADCCWNCRHWQGRRTSKYGDCYMVIIKLLPKLSDCHDDFGYGFSVPFDSHDTKYYVNSLLFKKLYRKLFTLPLTGAIQKEIVKEEDFVFDSVGMLYQKRISVLYLRTNHRYHCEHYVRREGE